MSGEPGHAGSGVAGDDPPRSLVFRVAGKEYACDATAIREIIRSAAVTRLPGASAAVCGIMNVRGTVVTVVDAGVLLHHVPADPAGAILVVDAGARGVGLAVDSVADVRCLRADEEYRRLDPRAAVARVVTLTEDE